MKRWNAWLGAALICAQVQAEEDMGLGFLTILASQPPRLLDEAQSEVNRQLCMMVYKEDLASLEKLPPSPDRVRRIAELEKTKDLILADLAVYPDLAEAMRELRKSPLYKQWPHWAGVGDEGGGFNRLRAVVADPWERQMKALPSVLEELRGLSADFRRKVDSNKSTRAVWDKMSKVSDMSKYVDALELSLEKVSAILSNDEKFPDGGEGLPGEAQNLRLLRGECRDIYAVFEAVTLEEGGRDEKLLELLLENPVAAAVLLLAQAKGGGGGTLWDSVMKLRQALPQPPAAPSDPSQQPGKSLLMYLYEQRKQNLLNASGPAFPLSPPPSPVHIQQPALNAAPSLEQVLPVIPELHKAAWGFRRKAVKIGAGREKAVKNYINTVNALIEPIRGVLESAYLFPDGEVSGEPNEVGKLRDEFECVYFNINLIASRFDKAGRLVLDDKLLARIMRDPVAQRVLRLAYAKKRSDFESWSSEDEEDALAETPEVAAGFDAALVRLFAGPIAAESSGSGSPSPRVGAGSPGGDPRGGDFPPAPPSVAPGGSVTAGFKVLPPTASNGLTRRPVAEIVDPSAPVK